MANEKSNILQGTLDLMVLQTLDSMGSMHDYGIARRIEQLSEEALLVNQGTIYLCLVRLVRRKWIAAQLAAETKNWERVSGVIGRLLQLSPGNCT
jgi:PadR family transcriptional regulator PadR